MATVLLGAVCAMLFPLLTRLLQVQHEVEQRQMALRELRNFVESTLFLTDTNPPSLSTNIREGLPNATLDVQRTPQAEAGEQVLFKLSWDAGPARPRSEVQLTCWLPTVAGAE